MDSRDRSYYAKFLMNKHNSLEEKKKEETRAHKAQIHVVVSVDGVDDIEKATAASSSSGMDEQMANTNVALAATLADARSMQVAEVIGAKREH
ncbi:unnamed protein product [Brassica napus]|uniref:(rape) hypothetical protein n=1 Tax=Brassica napus TaxID=3708 RepID=A0A816R8E1_BRANA|nr:unnamed protein product [Brassica napus]